MAEIRDPRKNASGCWDFTAYEAIRRVTESSLDKKLHKQYLMSRLIRSIHILCDRAGYQIVGRITLKDKKTGKIYK